MLEDFSKQRLDKETIAKYRALEAEIWPNCAACGRFFAAPDDARLSSSESPPAIEKIPVLKSRTGRKK